MQVKEDFFFRNRIPAFGTTKGMMNEFVMFLEVLFHLIFSVQIDNLLPSFLDFQLPREWALIYNRDCRFVQALNRTE